MPNTRLLYEIEALTLADARKIQHIEFTILEKFREEAAGRVNFSREPVALTKAVDFPDIATFSSWDFYHREAFLDLINQKLIAEAFLTKSTLINVFFITRFPDGAIPILGNGSGYRYATLNLQNLNHLEQYHLTIALPASLTLTPFKTIMMNPMHIDTIPANIADAVTDRICYGSREIFKERIASELADKINEHGYPCDAFLEVFVNDDKKFSSQVGAYQGVALPKIDLSTDDVYNEAAHILGFDHRLSRGFYQTQSHLWFDTALCGLTDVLTDNDPDFSAAIKSLINQVKIINLDLAKSNSSSDFLHRLISRKGGSIVGNAVITNSVDSYFQGEIIYAPIGWEGHAISVLLYQGYLAVINRGQYCNDQGGIAYYQLHSTINRDDIIAFLNCDSKQYSNKEFENLRKKIAESEPCYVDGTVSFQKYRTCSYVNKKSAIRALYVLIESHRKKLLPNAEICSMHVDKYKHFTGEMRLLFLNKVLAEKAKNNAENQRRLELLATYTMQHLDVTKAPEWEGLKRIIDHLKSEPGALEQLSLHLKKIDHIAWLSFETYKAVYERTGNLQDFIYQLLDHSCGFLVVASDKKLRELVLKTDEYKSKLSPEQLLFLSGIDANKNASLRLAMARYNLEEETQTLFENNYETTADYFLKNCAQGSVDHYWLQKTIYSIGVYFIENNLLFSKILYEKCAELDCYYISALLGKFHTQGRDEEAVLLFNSLTFTNKLEVLKKLVTADCPELGLGFLQDPLCVSKYSQEIMADMYARLLNARQEYAENGIGQISLGLKNLILNRLKLYGNAESYAHAVQALQSEKVASPKGLCFFMRDFPKLSASDFQQNSSQSANGTFPLAD